MKATTEQENESWVELNIDFLFNDSSINEWQAIFKAVRNDQELVLMKDGSLARINPETMNALKHMPEIESMNAGKYRFSRYMSLMMNNTGSLDEHGAPWREIQEKLLEAPEEPEDLSDELDSTLRDYRKDGVAWLQTMKDIGFNCVLADEMGLGKTIQALSLSSQVPTIKSSARAWLFAQKV